jgi:Domain of unknown function (DUF4124)
MMRLTVTLLTFLLAFSLSDSYAETYTWTDEQGTIHFTEDLGNVPPKSRNKARIVEETEAPREEKPASPALPATGQDATLQAAPLGQEGKPAPADIHAGKTFDQWVKDFKDQEAAMTAVRKRIVEITDLLKTPTAKKDDQEKLLVEYTTLLAQFNQMKSRYHQQVEIARKAGLQITIQQ